MGCKWGNLLSTFFAEEARWLKLECRWYWHGSVATAGMDDERMFRADLGCCGKCRHWLHGVKKSLELAMSENDLKNQLGYHQHKRTEALGRCTSMLVRCSAWSLTWNATTSSTFPPNFHHLLGIDGCVYTENRLKNKSAVEPKQKNKVVPVYADNPSAFSSLLGLLLAGAKVNQAGIFCLYPIAAKNPPTRETWGRMCTCLLLEKIKRYICNSTS